MEKDESQLTDVLERLLRELRDGRTIVLNRELIDTSKRGVMTVKHAAEWLDMDPRTLRRKLLDTHVVESRIINGTVYVVTRSLNRLVDGGSRG